MNEETTENRQNFRPPTPIAGLVSRLDNFMEATAKSKKWSMVMHLVIIIFTLTCIAIIWWSISLRLPQLEKNGAYLHQMNQMRNKIEQLQLRKSDTFRKDMMQKMQEHEKNLFTNKKAVVVWLKEQIYLAQEQGIRLHYELGKILPALTTHHAMSIKMQLNVTRASGKYSNYARMIRFVENIKYRDIPPHIGKISVKGSKGGANTMNIQATIWML